MAVNPELETRIEAEEPTQKLAVLIDGDNAQASVIEALLAEVARYGEATVKRIYGDFTAPTSAHWKQVLHQFGIKPVQQFAYTTGKNATDSTMIIDAMDLLYTRRFDGFCLVSSDSDFTGLAIRIREEGLTVYGFGEQKTPAAFRNACHKFVLTEVLKPITIQAVDVLTTSSKQTSSNANTIASPKASAQAKRATPKVPTKFFRQALEQASDDRGWAHLGNFGSYLTKLKPDFDPRNFGYKKLSDLVRAKKDIFEIEERTLPSGKGELYIKAK
ncbi:MAG: NYN domain-containing protein [Syntrophobacteraceae bacterium]